VLQTKLIDFATMQRLRRFARYWDLLGNSGNFRRTLPMLWRDGSPFRRFMELSDRLYAHMGRNHGIALQDLAEFLFEHLTRELNHDANQVATALWDDYRNAGRSDRPVFLRPYIAEAPIPRRRAETHVPARQARHL
jgi:hypothetical protein